MCNTISDIGPNTYSADSEALDNVDYENTDPQETQESQDISNSSNSQEKVESDPVCLNKNSMDGAPEEYPTDFNDNVKEPATDQDKIADPEDTDSLPSAYIDSTESSEGEEVNINEMTDVEYSNSDNEAKPLQDFNADTYNDTVDSNSDGNIGGLEPDSGIPEDDESFSADNGDMSDNDDTQNTTKTPEEEKVIDPEKGASITTVDGKTYEGLTPEYTQANADADASELYKASLGGLTGLGTDEEGILKVMENKTSGDIDLIRQSFKDHYEKDLDTVIREEFDSFFDSKEDQEKAEQLLKGDISAKEAVEKANAKKEDEPVKKELSPEKAAEKIKKGFDDQWRWLGFTDGEAEPAREVLAGKTKEEIDVIAEEFEKKYGESLEDAIKNDLGGRDEFEIMQIYENGAPQTAQERLDQLKARKEFEDDGIGNELATGIQTLFKGQSDEEILDRNITTAETFLKDKNIPVIDQDAEKLESSANRYLSFGETDLENVKSAKDSASSTMTTVAAIGGAAITTPFTGGLSWAPVLAIAAGTAGVSGGVTYWATTGDSSKVEDRVYQTAMSSVDGATMYGGTKAFSWAGKKFVTKTTDTAIKNLGRRAMPWLANGVVDGTGGFTRGTTTGLLEGQDMGTSLKMGVQQSALDSVMGASMIGAGKAASRVVNAGKKAIGVPKKSVLGLIEKFKNNNVLQTDAGAEIAEQAKKMKTATSQTNGSRTYVMSTHQEMDDAFNQLKLGLEAGDVSADAAKNFDDIIGQFDTKMNEIKIKTLKKRYEAREISHSDMGKVFEKYDTIDKNVNSIVRKNRASFFENLDDVKKGSEKLKKLYNDILNQSQKTMTDAQRDKLVQESVDQAEALLSARGETVTRNGNKLEIRPNRRNQLGHIAESVKNTDTKLIFDPDNLIRENAAGYNSSQLNGKNTVGIDFNSIITGTPPGKISGTLMHELGHAKENFNVFSSQGKGPGLFSGEMKGLRNKPININKPRTEYEFYQSLDEPRQAIRNISQHASEINKLKKSGVKQVIDKIKNWLKPNDINYRMQQNKINNHVQSIKHYSDRVDYMLDDQVSALNEIVSRLKNTGQRITQATNTQANNMTELRFEYDDLCYTTLVKQKNPAQNLTNDQIIGHLEKQAEKFSTIRDSLKNAIKAIDEKNPSVDDIFEIIYKTNLADIDIQNSILP